MQNISARRQIGQRPRATGPRDTLGSAPTGRWPLRRDEDPNERPSPDDGTESPPTGHEADPDPADDQEAMEPDLGDAG
jgi:hypothetical protein